MVQSRYSITWESFNSSICGGFSSLQQNGELVDMTLAADGHFVKVHQVLMALVSPYLKELITSAPCQHPVIFLNNVSHTILTLLLEYVYTGEVMVPIEHLVAFTQTAKALHIKGLEDISSNQSLVFPTSVKRPSEVISQLSGTKRPVDPTYSGFGQPTLPAKAKKIIITGQKNTYSPAIQNEQSASQPMDELDDYAIMDDTVGHDTDDDLMADNQLETVAAGDSKDPNQASSVQFTVSNRGSLQVILNRYIYNMHSIQRRTGTRRWRCVDYRNNRCQAYIVTQGNMVLNRANLHNHAFHDKKILQKIEKKSVFTALDEVATYQENLKEIEKEYDTYGDQGKQGKSSLSERGLKDEID